MFTADSTKKFFKAMADTEKVRVVYDSGIEKPVSTRDGTITLPIPTIYNEEEWASLAHSEASYLFEPSRFLLGACDSLAPDDKAAPEDPKEQDKATRLGIGKVLSQHIAEQRSYGEYKGRDAALDYGAAKRITETADLLESVDLETLAPAQGLLASVLSWDAEARKAVQGYDVKVAPDIPCSPHYCDPLRSLLSPRQLAKIHSEEDLLAAIESVVKLLESPSDDQQEQSDSGEGDGDQGDPGDRDSSDSLGGSDGGDAGGDQGDQDDPGSPSDDSGAGDPKSSGESGSPGESESPESGDNGDAGTPSDANNGDSGGAGSSQADGGQGDPSNAESSMGEDSSSASTLGSTPTDSLSGQASESLTTGEADHEGHGRQGLAPIKTERLPDDLLDSYKDTLESDHPESVDLWEGANKTPHDSLKPESKEYIPLEEQMVVAEKTLLSGEFSTGKKNRAAAYAEKSVVSKTIRKYLQAMSQDSWAYGKTRGTIATRSIAQCYSGARNPRIFRQKQSSRLKMDTAITLLLDCSGSMSGTRYTIGSACVLSMSKTLTSLGIPHEILGFTDDRRLITYEFKPFASQSTQDKLGRALASNEMDMNYNADGESLMIAAERLMHRSEKNKVLIVLSDGQPSGYYLGNGEKYLKDVCELIEEKSPIDLHAIGIESQAPKNYYKNCQCIHRPEELDDALMSLLKRSVMK